MRALSYFIRFYTLHIMSFCSQNEHGQQRRCQRLYRYGSHPLRRTEVHPQHVQNDEKEQSDHRAHPKERPLRCIQRTEFAHPCQYGDSGCYGHQTNRCRICLLRPGMHARAAHQLLISQKVVKLQAGGRRRPSRVGTQNS